MRTRLCIAFLCALPAAACVTPRRPSPMAVGASRAAADAGVLASARTVQDPADERDRGAGGDARVSLAVRVGLLKPTDSPVEDSYEEIPRFGLDLRLRGSGPFSVGAGFEYMHEQTDTFVISMTSFTSGRREMTLVSVPLTVAVHTASADAFRRGTPDFHVGVGVSFFDVEESLTMSSPAGSGVTERSDRGVGYHVMLGLDVPLGTAGVYVSPRIRYSSEELRDGPGPERDFGGLFLGIDLGVHF